MVVNLVSGMQAYYLVLFTVTVTCLLLPSLDTETIRYSGMILSDFYSTIRGHLVKNSMLL